MRLEIVHDAVIVKKMIAIFDVDWKVSEPAVEPAGVDIPAKKVAKAITKQLDVEAKVEEILDRLIESKSQTFEHEEVAQVVRYAVRAEVQEAVANALHEVAVAVMEQTAGKSWIIAFSKGRTT